MYSFGSYLKKGWNINLTVGIDFTLSNGPPSDPASLHYLGEQEDGTFVPNQYEIAMEKVGNILDFYAFEHRYSAFGFGAMLPGESEVNHCFPLNGNYEDPSIIGLGEMLKTYRKTLSKVELNGPTRFHDVLGAVEGMVKQRLHMQVYHLLLMLTDGVIHDMRETIDLIVRMSHSPVSIIIIGIGDANFDNMDVLDADDEPLTDSQLQPQGHDIVQFVQYRDYADNASLMVEHVLKELPDQFVKYMKDMRIKPGDKIGNNG